MNLRDYLHFNKIKTKDLADEIGISYAYFMMIKNNRYIPSLEIKMKIELATGGQVKTTEIGVQHGK